MSLKYAGFHRRWLARVRRTASLAFRVERPHGTALFALGRIQKAKAAEPKVPGDFGERRRDAAQLLFPANEVEELLLAAGER